MSSDALFGGGSKLVRRGFRQLLRAVNRRRIGWREGAPEAEQAGGEEGRDAAGALLGSEISGVVAQTSREESEAYFATRPLGSQLGAWASQQSAVIPDRAFLERQLAEVTARFQGQPIPAPPHWGGFRLCPTEVEFWQGRRNRLHDRLRYRKTDGGFVVERLSP